MSKIRVVIVDDSALIRNVISNILSSDPEIEVVGTAANPLIAREKIKLLNPDVLTLDVQMPEMDGIAFLEKIMMLRPMPVVMVSSLTEKGASETVKALALGAIDYVTKPSSVGGVNADQFAFELIQKVKCAAAAKIKIQNKNDINNRSKIEAGDQYNPHAKIVAIGSSTGGVEALTKLITSLPSNAPAILIAQHMPAKFTASFAARLNTDTSLKVVEAEDNMLVMPGHVYIAPGNYHMRIHPILKANAEFCVKISQEDLVNGHRPSVDILFQSFAQHVAKKTIAFILTGMGNDGAMGIKAIRDNGGETYGQNQESCLVYGMPKAAKECNGTSKEVHLNEIPEIIMR